MSTGVLLAGLCVWQDYTINSRIPQTAVLIGINIYDSGDRTQARGVDFAYAVRVQEGNQMALYRTYQNRKATIGFIWDEPLKRLTYRHYHGSSNKAGQILTCDKRLVHMCADQLPFASIWRNNKCCLVGSVAAS